MKIETMMKALARAPLEWFDGRYRDRDRWDKFCDNITTGIIRRYERLQDAITILKGELAMSEYMRGEGSVRESMLSADNARLRGLLKDGEFGDEHYICTWCKSGGQHEPTCPAFNIDGSVK